MKKFLIITTCIVASSSVWFIGGLLRTPEGKEIPKVKEKNLPLVQALTVRKATVAKELQATGEVVATKAVTIKATVEGPIAFCPWREGDIVDQAGQKLIEIKRPLYQEDVRVAEAGLMVAKARLADLRAGTRPQEIARSEEAVKKLDECASFAKKDLERIEKLVESGGLPSEASEKARVNFVKCRADLKSAREKLQMLKDGPTKTAIAIQEALVKQAEQKLAQAKSRLTETRIVSPFKGIVTKVYVRPGDLAVAKGPLLEMFEADSLRIRFAVPESEAAVVQKGMKAQVILDAYPNQSFRAEITRIYPALDHATRTRTVEALIENRASLVPGMFARISLTLETIDDGIFLPESTLITDGGGERRVFAILNGKITERKVKTGVEKGSCIQIIEGIRPGELIAVSGHERLGNGIKVRIMKQEAVPSC